MWREDERSEYDVASGNTNMAEYTFCNESFDSSNRHEVEYRNYRFYGKIISSKNKYLSICINNTDKVIRTLRLLCVAFCIFTVTMLSCGGYFLSPAFADNQDLQNQTIDVNQQQGHGKVVVDRGHIDFGPTLNTGTWKLQIHDDTGDVSYWRNPDDMVFHVKDTAKVAMPQNNKYAFIGEKAGTSLWVIPQTQQHNVVWMGWNTQEPNVLQQLDRGANFSLEKVYGPGKLDVYLENGTVTPPTVIWTSSRRYPQKTWIDVNAHTHVNWVFHKAGEYHVTIALSGILKDGRKVSTTGTLHFAVSDSVNPQDVFRHVQHAKMYRKNYNSNIKTDNATNKSAKNSQLAHRYDSDEYLLWFILGICIVLIIVILLITVTVKSQRDRKEAVAKFEQKINKN